MKQWSYQCGMSLLLAGLISSPCLAKEVIPQIRYTGEKYRDPTVSPLSVTVIQTPPDIESVQLPPLEVKGIIWGEREPRAIVNNRVVRKGDLLDGVEILEISQKGIRVFFKGKSHFLRPGGMIEEGP